MSQDEIKDRLGALAKKYSLLLKGTEESARNILAIERERYQNDIIPEDKLEICFQLIETFYKQDHKISLELKTTLNKMNNNANYFNELINQAAVLKLKLKEINRENAGAYYNAAQKTIVNLDSIDKVFERNYEEITNPDSVLNKLLNQYCKLGRYTEDIKQNIEKAKEVSGKVRDYAFKIINEILNEGFITLN